MSEKKDGMLAAQHHRNFICVAESRESKVHSRVKNQPG
jgi:hypothetical protein